MEIEEKELDKEQWGYWAILIKNYGMDLHVVNCWLEALECDTAMSSIAQIMRIAVDQKLFRNEALGCKSLYIEMIYLLSIMSILLFQSNNGASNDC